MQKRRKIYCYTNRQGHGILPKITLLHWAAVSYLIRGRMEILVAFLLNVVYGFIFFLAFLVLIMTFVYFSMAIWENFGKRLLRRS